MVRLPLQVAETKQKYNKANGKRHSDDDEDRRTCNSIHSSGSHLHNTLNTCTVLYILTIVVPYVHTHYDKKDGYRQQNVRQRQKLISIIDYDVCMTFY